MIAIQRRKAVLSCDNSVGAGEGNRTLMTSLEGCDYAGCDLHWPT
jgi:hypothetical protein